MESAVIYNQRPTEGSLMTLPGLNVVIFCIMLFSAALLSP